MRSHSNAHSRSPHRRPHTSVAIGILLDALTRALNRRSLIRSHSNAHSQSPRALSGDLARQFLKTPSHDRSLTSSHSLSSSSLPLCIAVRSALQLVSWRDAKEPILTAWINASTTNRSVRATDAVATSRARDRER